MYKLELHEVDVHSTQLSVKESALKNFTTEWPETGGPYDVHFQLPELDAVRLYAIILEVHDNAGNVGYARRLVLYDNSSTVEVATPLKVTSANPSVPNEVGSRGGRMTESVIVSIDHTGPDVSMEGLRGTFGRDGLYVHNNTDLSTMVLVVHASDPHSGVKTLTWIIGTKDGSDDVGRGAAAVQRLNDSDIFNIIELSYSTIQENNLDGHLSSQHLGSNLQYLYDLDIDFAESDIMLAAVLTNSADKNVQWFLMTKCHVPADGNCASDPACVTTQTSDDGKVVFPRDQSKFKDGHVYYACAIVSSTTDEGVLRRSRSYPGAEDLARLVSVGQRTTWTFDHLDIVSGSKCVATVKAEDRVGHVTQVWSKAIIIDNTPPKVGHVWAGAITQEKFLPREDLPVHWDGVEDVESAFVWKRDFEQGKKYYVTVEACNKAGVCGVASSSIDVTPPEMVTAPCFVNPHDGKPMDRNYDRSVMRLQWKFRDPDSSVITVLLDEDHLLTDGDNYWATVTACNDAESDIDKYYLSMGKVMNGEELSNADDILQPNDAGLNTTFSVPTVGLQQGVRYYVTVRAVNSAGLMTTAVSDGVTVDATQPAPGVVFASRFYTDRHVQESATTLHASWYGFEDRHSGLTSYKVGLYDAEDPTSAVVPLTDAGISNKFTFDGLSLLHEHRY
nr:hypothetical protein BaRGS_027226 [Batillaria attramentaria]